MDPKVVSCVRCNTDVTDGSPVCSFCRAPLPSSGPALPTPGEQLDRGYARFILDKSLGSGAMGIVHRAWMYMDPEGPRGREAPRLVALKMLRGVSASLDVRTLFTNEAELMRRIDHPNIVRFIDFFEARGTLWLAMEYIEGDTLSRVVSRSVARAQVAGGTTLPGLPFQRAWYYFQQLLGALAVTHALGIVHRDVKPSNVLVRRDGVVKLTDYGIANSVRRTVITSPQADPQQNVAGTGPYMSPEHVMGHPLDGRSDLYSSAILLYELLTGRMPFDAEDKSEWIVRMQHLTTAPTPLRTYLPQAPPVLEALLLQAMAKNPQERFQSAMEFGEAVRRALQLPDTPEWRAQSELAREVARYRGGTAKLEEAPIGELREVIRTRYQTAPLSKT